MASRTTFVRKVVFFVAAAVILTAIGLGVGLGIGLDKDDHKSSASLASASSESLQSSTPTPQSLPSSSSIISSPSSLSFTSTLPPTTTSSTTPTNSFQTLTSTTESSQISSTTSLISVSGTPATSTSSSLTSSQASISTSSPATTLTASSSSFYDSRSTLVTTPNTTVETVSLTTYPNSRETTTPANPVQTAGPPAFLGNVTSDNTYDIRDLGFQGRIGNIWINTYGDTIPCKGPLQKGCFGLEAPNSASVATDSPTVFTDVNASVKGHAQIFCPLLGRPEEPPSFGMGLTSVVQTGNHQGIVFTLRNNRTAKPNIIVGAGIGIVSTASSKPVCTRPEAQWWDAATEPYYGDHDAILAPDGYIYAYGGRGAVDGGQALFLARVPQHSATSLAEYQYWNGQEFTSERLINPTEDQAVLMAGQGSIVWSAYYNMFLYFKPGCPGGACIVVQAAHYPQGPWSDTYGVFGTGDSDDHFLMYAPVVQKKWTSNGGKNMVLMYTGRGLGFGNVLQAINITFA